MPRAKLQVPWPMMLAQYQVRSRTSAHHAASWRRSGPPGTGTSRTRITARVPALTAKVTASSTQCPAGAHREDQRPRDNRAGHARCAARGPEERIGCPPSGRVHRARDEGQGGWNAERRGGPSDRRHSDRRDVEMAREQEQSDRELRESGNDIGRERRRSGPGPVDDDSREWQQCHPRQHAADQDDGQPGRRAGGGDDRERERRRSDRIAERVDYPSGEQDAEVPFAAGRSHAPTLAGAGKGGQRFSGGAPLLQTKINQPVHGPGQSWTGRLPRSVRPGAS